MNTRRLKPHHSFYFLEHGERIAKELTDEYEATPEQAETIVALAGKIAGIVIEPDREHAQRSWLFLRDWLGLKTDIPFVQITYPVAPNKQD